MHTCASPKQQYTIVICHTNNIFPHTYIIHTTLRTQCNEYNENESEKQRICVHTTNNIFMKLKGHDERKREL